MKHYKSQSGNGNQDLCSEDKLPKKFQLQQYLKMKMVLIKERKILKKVLKFFKEKNQDLTKKSKILKANLIKKQCHKMMDQILNNLNYLRSIQHF